MISNKEVRAGSKYKESVKQKKKLLGLVSWGINYSCLIFPLG